MIFLFFNWVAAAAIFTLLAYRSRQTKGIGGILLGSAMQIGALLLYMSERQRLIGQPDLLYVWITPSLICGLSIIILLGAMALNILAEKPRRAD